MTFDFPLILLSIILFTGVVTLIDIIFCLAKNEAPFATIKRPVIIEYSRAFFPVLLAVFLIRSFVMQPYRVPTGSLEPTVIPGDFIFVNQYDYGLRFPVWNKKILSIHNPKTGQIALFYYPVDHKINFVKRVIGVPGDKISYINKVLYINGKEQKQIFVKNVTRINDFGQLITYQEMQENLEGVKHNIFLINNDNYPAVNFYNITVPTGEYFMMGDNRDESDDSRYWGFVPDHDFIGHALFIWMSWNSRASNMLNYIRWNRIGKKL